MAILGLDIGGVISDTQFPKNDNFVPGAINGLARLREERYGDNIHLVSKCGQGMQDRILAQFDTHNFYRRTGVRRDHVWFCRERIEKVPIARQLGLTSFVEDRLQILGFMRGTVEKLYLLRAKDHEVRRHIEHLPYIDGVFSSWEDLLPVLLNA